MPLRESLTPLRRTLEQWRPAAHRGAARATPTRSAFLAQAAILWARSLSRHPSAALRQRGQQTRPSTLPEGVFSPFRRRACGVTFLPAPFSRATRILLLSIFRFLPPQRRAQTTSLRREFQFPLRFQLAVRHGAKLRGLSVLCQKPTRPCSNGALLVIPEAATPRKQPLSSSLRQLQLRAHFL